MIESFFIQPEPDQGGGEAGIHNDNNEILLRDNNKIRNNNKM